MLFLCLLLVAPADAGKRRRPDPEPAPSAGDVAPLLDASPWFPGLIFPLGPIPEGLANPSASGCAACHPAAHGAWSAGGHAGPPSAALLAASAAEPACTACHLPLVEQRDRTGSFGFGPEQPPSQAQPFSATLWSEGVGCAACHVRGGSVLGPRHLEGAPHPVTGSATLGGDEGCATCHQLEVDEVVWYDTWSSWKASPYAEAGISCSDCHGSISGHGQASGPGVSLLVDVDRRSLVRGGEPLQVSVVVQNTGAGHSWPSTGPYRGAELVVRLVGPVDPKTGRAEAGRFVTPLARTLGPDGQAGPDTRIPPMGSASFPVSVALDQQAVAGPWHLEVALRRVGSTPPKSIGEADSVDEPYLTAPARVWLPLEVD